MFKKLLEGKKQEILENWREMIFSTYPRDSIRFLSGENDRFNNPVGHYIKVETEAILNGLINNVKPGDLADSLDRIVRIRSVQDFSPSQAVSFLRLLKKAVRDILNGEMNRHDYVEQYLEFDYGIDSLIDLAFDLFCRCREKIYEIKVTEIKKKSEVLFRRAHKSDLAFEENGDSK